MCHTRIRTLTLSSPHGRRWTAARQTRRRPRRGRRLRPSGSAPRTLQRRPRSRSPLCPLVGCRPVLLLGACFCFLLVALACFCLLSCLLLPELAFGCPCLAGCSCLCTRIAQRAAAASPLGHRHLSIKYTLCLFMPAVLQALCVHADPAYTGMTPAWLGQAQTNSTRHLLCFRGLLRTTQQAFPRTATPFQSQEEKTFVTARSAANKTRAAQHPAPFPYLAISHISHVYYSVRATGNLKSFVWRRVSGSGYDPGDAFAVAAGSSPSLPGRNYGRQARPRRLVDAARASMTVHFPVPSGRLCKSLRPKEVRTASACCISCLGCGMVPKAPVGSRTGNVHRARHLLAPLLPSHLWIGHRLSIPVAGEGFERSQDVPGCLGSADSCRRVLGSVRSMYRRWSTLVMASKA